MHSRLASSFQPSQRLCKSFGVKKVCICVCVCVCVYVQGNPANMCTYVRMCNVNMLC